MLSAYPACFYKENEGSYSVIFPDLDHLSTCGDTLEEALKMSVDCLAGYLFGLKQNGETAPSPSAPEKINPDDEYEDYAEAFVNLITVDVDEYAKTHFEKAVKKTLTIPLWLNELAVQNKINFSQVLQKALKAELHLTNA